MSLKLAAFVSDTSRQSDLGGKHLSAREIVPHHLPSDLIRQLAQFFADARSLFLVTMHDGILKRCAAEATLRRGDSPTANPKGAQASADVKSLDRLYRTCPP